MDCANVAVRRPRDRHALEQPHRPRTPGTPRTRVRSVSLSAFVSSKYSRLRVHDPDLGVGHVEDLAGGALQDAGEDRGLVLEQERREGDREDEPEILRPVAGEHSQGDEVHLATRGERPRLLDFSARLIKSLADATPVERPQSPTPQFTHYAPGMEPGPGARSNTSRKGSPSRYTLR